MTNKETAQILFLLKEYYPDAFDNSNMENRVRAWHLILQDQPYELMQAAVVAFVSADTRGFMPAVGQLKEKALFLSAEKEMTELEAWSLVQKALRNGIYGSAEEFDKLPPAVQQAVGGPQQLREWAMMDSQEVSTVVASNFQRSFRTWARRERELQALPTVARQCLKAHGDGAPRPLLQ